MADGNPSTSRTPCFRSHNTTTKQKILKTLTTCSAENVTVATVWFRFQKGRCDSTVTMLTSAFGVLLMPCGLCGGQTPRAWVFSGCSRFLPLTPFHQSSHHHPCGLYQSCLKALKIEFILMPLGNYGSGCMDNDWMNIIQSRVFLTAAMNLQVSIELRNWTHCPC